MYKYKKIEKLMHKLADECFKMKLPHVIAVQMDDEDEATVPGYDFLAYTRLPDAKVPTNAYIKQASDILEQPFQQHGVFTEYVKDTALKMEKTTVLVHGEVKHVEVEQ